MNPDRKSNQPPGRSTGASGPSRSGANQPLAETEPTAARTPSPVWLIVLSGLLLYWAQLYLDNYAGGFNPQVYEPYRSYKQVADANPKSGDAELIAAGEALYVNCAACHQANGMGTPGQFPPLAGSEWVTAPNPARLIRIILQGPTGPYTVSGVNWNVSAAMPPFASAFTDQQIAGILSFIRSNWGNTAPAVTPDQVKAVREETKDRFAPWTMDELLKVPETP
jgi:mono/diheme cytochrome c family protein